MTTQAIYRCRHCNQTYTYYPSGCPYDLEALNDGNYCPQCKEVVKKALEDVPQRVEKFMKPYDKVTLEEIKAAVEADKAEGLRWRRCAMPLYDMENPKNRNITGWVTIDGQEILYSWWEGPDVAGKDVRITIEMERNLETGAEYPWKHISNRYP